MTEISSRLKQGRTVAGFTLVEILIVLGIVSILTAVLLPVFGRVRENARRTTCNSNLRQIGLAMGMYVQDNNRFYPPFRQATYSCCWLDCLAPYARSPKIFECPSSQNGQYEPVSSCYIISEDDQEGLVASALRKSGSYDLNEMDDLWRNGKRVASEVRLRRPESIILALDRSGGGLAYAGISSILNLTQEQQLITAGMETRHRGGNNVLFVDGHVKWMNLSALAHTRLWRATER